MPIGRGCGWRLRYLLYHVHVHVCALYTSTLMYCVLPLSAVCAPGPQALCYNSKVFCDSRRVGQLPRSVSPWLLHVSTYVHTCVVLYIHVHVHVHVHVCSNNSQAEGCLDCETKGYVSWAWHLPHRQCKTFLVAPHPCCVFDLTWHRLRTVAVHCQERSAL